MSTTLTDGRLDIKELNRRKDEKREQRKELLLARKIANPTITRGKLVEGICSENTLQNYLRDPIFRERYHAAGMEKLPETGRPNDPLRKYNFVEFRRIVLGRHTFPHQLEWATWFETEENDHILILCPPESSKTTFVLDWILYLIYLNPNVMIGYASKSLPHSIKQVSKVKNIIEQNETLRNLCGELVPQPGDPHPWRDSYFTVRQREWSAGMDEADYTLSAYGSGSQITGSRFDLIVFDDPDDVNVGPADREKIWNVVLQAGESRLGTDGRMVIIGNRQDNEDVYRRILEQWAEDPELWAVYTQSAIIEDNPAAPVCFWPEKFGAEKTKRGAKKNRNVPAIADADLPTYHQRAYEFFDKKRRRLGHRFNLIYQNNPDQDRMKDFTREMVDSALDNTVVIGKVPPGAVVVCSFDPAPSGGAAVLVYAVLPPDSTGLVRRQIVDFEWGMNWRHTGTTERIRWYGDTYKPRWWVIERSATTKLFLEDPAILEMIRRQGAWLYDLTTSQNKDAGDFAVASLRELFLGNPTPLILPGATPADKDRTKPLRDQLVEYYPGTTSPHDGPMALWFAERCVRDKNIVLQMASRGRGQAKTQGWQSPYGGSWKGGQWSLKPNQRPAPAPGSMVESDGKTFQVVQPR